MVLGCIGEEDVAEIVVEASRGMVKAEPTGSLTFQGYLAVGLGIGSVLVGLYLAVARPLSGGNNLDFGARAVLVGGAALAFGVVLLRKSSRARGFQRARANAAVSRTDTAPPVGGRHARVATGQFYDLRLQPNWTRLALYAGWLYVMFWALSIVLLVVGDYPWDSLVAEAALIAIIFALGPVILWIVGAHQHLLASDWSFEDRSRLGGAKRIAWEEATLFAICPPRAGAGLAIVYELSSPVTIIRWVRLRHPMPWLPSRPESATRPVVPFDIYEQRADALIEYIQAATGLALRDLR